MHFFYIIMSRASRDAESRSRLSMWEISGMVGRGVLKGLNKRVTESLVFFGNVARWTITTKQIVNRNIELPEPLFLFEFEFLLFPTRFQATTTPTLVEIHHGQPQKIGRLSKVKTWSYGRSSGGAYHSTLVNYSGKCINHHYSTDQEVDSPAVGKRFHQQPPQ